MPGVVAALDRARQSLPRRAQGAWSKVEVAAVERLLGSKERLLVSEDGRIDTKSGEGYAATGEHLENLDSVSRALQLDPHPRKYRHDFTLNYRALFPDQSRNFRVDIFEASAEQENIIWVNGDKFEFTPEAMQLARELQRTWAGLDELLENRLSAGDKAAWSKDVALKERLQSALAAVDKAWADFEQRYISELIKIEERARRLVVQAVDHEQRLQLMEAARLSNCGNTTEKEYQEEQKLLVQCISHLNSVANFKRKGRSDLEAEVLFTAQAALLDRLTTGGEPGASEVLATDVVESFSALRGYLREVANCLERVDPHLCNNPGLVARLVDWEESWEVATQYMQSKSLHQSLCGMVDEMREIEKFAPELGKMCEECDVELFMVLPRITWLIFFCSQSRQMPLIRNLLPDCFEERKGSLAVSAKGQGIALQQLIDAFETTRGQIMEAVSPGAQAPRVAWEVLARRAIAGPGSQSTWAGLTNEPAAETARKAVESFMHEMERWSIDLQRHQASDWNQFSAVLLQCLSGGVADRAPKEDSFTI